MSPPSFSDLGQKARNVLSENYSYGNLSIKVDTKTKAGVSIKSSAKRNIENGKVVGDIESEHKLKNYGVTIKNKWTTDNDITGEASIKNTPIDGLDLKLITTFSPQTGKKSGVLKTTYSHDYVKANCSTILDLAGPAFDSGLVLGYNGWLAGARFIFDSAKSQLTKHSFAVGYNGGDYTLHANVNNGQDFDASIFNKVTKAIKLGVGINWKVGANSTLFTLGGMYKMDGDTKIVGKVSNSNEVALGCKYKLKDGIKVSLSTLVDAKDLNSGNHKVGFGLEFKA